MARRAHPIPEDEWEQNRSVISNMYRTRSLKGVVQHMAASAGFYATEKQFERRISKWNLEKNVKAHEKEKLLAENSGRHNIRGYDVPFRKLLRYTKQKRREARKIRQPEESIASDVILNPARVMIESNTTVSEQKAVMDEDHAESHSPTSRNPESDSIIEHDSECKKETCQAPSYIHFYRLTTETSLVHILNIYLAHQEAPIIRCRARSTAVHLRDALNSLRTKLGQIDEDTVLVALYLQLLTIIMNDFESYVTHCRGLEQMVELPQVKELLLKRRTLAYWVSAFRALRAFISQQKKFKKLIWLEALEHASPESFTEDSALVKLLEEEKKSEKEAFENLCRGFMYRDIELNGRLEELLRKNR